MAAAVAHQSHMHPGSDMGGPPFSSRRQNAGNLPAFELPPPSLHNSHKYQYAVHGNQGSQTPGSLSSVGNLLTPPSTVGGQDVSPSPTGTVPSLSTQVSQAPQQQQQQHQQQQQQQQQQHYNNGYTSWSPSPSHQQQYYTHHQSNAQNFQHNRMPYSPAPTVVRGSHPHSPQTSEGAPMQPPYDLPSFPASAPLTPATGNSMASIQAPSHHQIHPSMMGSNTPVSSAGNHPSPVHAQEQFNRAPPTPTYYTHQHPHSQPHSPFPFSSGPQQQMTLSSSGPMVSRAQMSPATTGPMPNLPAPMHSPANMQSRFTSYGPVMSNMHNPNGQPMLVGALPHGMVANFNSGHAANLQTMYGSPAPQSQPQNDRPFKCDQCPQSFNRNHDLKRHKRIHLAVKPFPCGHCDKSFSRKDALKRHVLVKGCGKPGDATSPLKQDSATASASPQTKSSGSENGDVKPLVS